MQSRTYLAVPYAEKNQAIARQIAECHLAGQPILVGTVSIERSEQLSDLLSRYEYKVEVSRTLKPEYAGKAKVVKVDIDQKNLVLGASYAFDLAGGRSEIDLGYARFDDEAAALARHERPRPDRGEPGRGDDPDGGRCQHPPDADHRTGSFSSRPMPQPRSVAMRSPSTPIR